MLNNISHYRVFFTTIIFLTEILFAQSKQPWDASYENEVLVVISRNNMSAIWKEISISQLHLYHKLGNSYFFGTNNNTLSEIQNADIPFIRIDEHPWQTSYAVVEQCSRAAKKNSINNFARVLFSEENIAIVAGDAHGFEQLRQHGFTVVEIQKKEIPFDFSKTYFPSDVLEHDDTIASIIANVSDSTIRNYIQMLQNFGTRYYSKPTHDTVVRWIKKQFQNFGIADVALDSFPYNSTSQKNVVATIPGTLEPSAEIIVGGHLDSYSSNINQAPGADDNASGTAAAMEMARVLQRINYQPRHTLRFIGFAAEEAGLIGSGVYAQKAHQQNRNIKVMMNYDMIGYRNPSQSDRDFYIVWYPGSEAFSNLHAATAQSYTTLNPILTTSYRSGSDSWSFYQQNFNSVFCIERDFSPYYHSPNDLIQYLDIPYANEIIRAGLAMLLTLDQLPPLLDNVEVRDKGNGTSLFAKWDASAVLDFSKYKISLGTTSGNYDTSYFTTNSSFTINNLTSGTPYFIGVSVVDLTGSESIVVEKSATPFLVPRAPVGISAENFEGKILLKWNKNSEMDVRGYNLYRSQNPFSTFTILNAFPIPDTLWNDSSVSSGTYFYFATALDSSGNESSHSDTVAAANVSVLATTGETFTFTLSQNYPNPFNSKTAIRFQLSAGSDVRLKIYDVSGQEVATLVSNKLAAGTYSVTWDATDFPSGIYFYQLKTNDGKHSLMKKILLLK
jgi:hypothetical protein